MGRRPDIDGRELLLEAALQLFGEHGVEAVSIRAINREAGLGPASVHYHFGTKDALLDAVLDTYGHAVLEPAKARTQQLAESDAAVTARALVRMLLEPYLDLLAMDERRGRSWVKLMAQLVQQDPDRLLDRHSAKAVSVAASRAYPKAAPRDIRRALRMCLVVMVSQLAHTPLKGRHALDVELLVDFLSGGLDAALGRPLSATA